MKHNACATLKTNVALVPYLAKVRHMDVRTWKAVCVTVINRAPDGGVKVAADAKPTNSYPHPSCIIS